MKDWEFKYLCTGGEGKWESIYFIKDMGFVEGSEFFTTDCPSCHINHSFM